eukprot:TRINITY_DN113784_c0_g1_i1.p1 TRINITY_DN113784_c0_g1~~TRINITY_DN113784_c0_g1_i1.p1  ORF type:complete len:197 (-),score=2.41 TRINITY_DN113784_c0_g1_i1:200-790(-)
MIRLLLALALACSCNCAHQHPMLPTLFSVGFVENQTTFGWATIQVHGTQSPTAPFAYDAYIHETNYIAHTDTQFVLKYNNTNATDPLGGTSELWQSQKVNDGPPKCGHGKIAGDIDGWSLFRFASYSGPSFMFGVACTNWTYQGSPYRFYQRTDGLPLAEVGVSSSGDWFSVVEWFNSTMGGDTSLFTSYKRWPCS